ncbi:MAG: PAS domain S-box protein [Candidatus Thermoplasmatota archaeon]|nr:PAS domain S-box protein [Candidatus Thermoplasmatota archaeon]
MQMKILLVDDDPAYLEVLKFFLERDGVFVADVATSARKALDILAKSREHEAVVSDFMMPDIDGLEFLKILRAQGIMIPFIMLTGRGREDVAIHALNSGADFYIAKGGDPKTQYPELSNMLTKSIKQKRSEREVSESERFLSSIFDSIQDGISVLDANYNIIRVNRAMERWYPHSLPLAGKKCYEAYHGRSIPCEICPVHHTLIHGVAHREVVPKTDKSGATVGWFELYSFPMSNWETGEVERIVEYVRDISDSERARVALLEIEERYRQLVELANIGIMMVDGSGEITFANPRIAHMLGRPGEKLDGLSLYSFLDSPWSEMVRASLQRHRSSGEQQESEFLRSDGSRLQVLLGASSIFDSGGKYLGALIVASELTETKKMMESLLRSESKFSTMFRASPYMMLICRQSDKHVVEVNERYLNATGYARSDLLGRTLSEVGAFENDFCHRAEEILSSTGSAVDLEVKFKTKSGEMRLARMLIEPIELAGEKCIMIAGLDITDEASDPIELRRERDILRSVLESSTDCIVIANMEGLILNVNPAVMKLFSYKSRDEVIGKNAFALLGGDDRDNAFAIARQIREHGEISEIPFKLQTPGGGILEGELSARLVKDPLGNPVYFIGILRDMTERILYEKALKRALAERRELEAIINKSPAVVFLWRNSGGWPVEFVSENVHQFGYTSSELMKGEVPFADMVHPDDIQRIASEVREYISEDVDYFAQLYRIVSPLGDVFWVDDRTLIRRDNSGAVTHLQGIVVDVSDRKRIEDLLALTEARFKTFMDNSPAVAFMKDTLGKYLYVNKAMENTVGARGSELVGRTDAELYSEETAKMLREIDERVLGTMETQENIEIIPGADGPHEWLAYKFPIPDPSGDGFVIGGVRLDISELRRYQQAIEQANTKLSLLSSITRHDIMNQLSIVLGWSDMLLGSPNDKNLIKHLESINKAAHLIRHQLEFTADYQEVGVKAPMWVNANDSIEDGISGLEMQGVEIEVELKDVSLYVDQMVEKVFHNLVENSLRHGERVTKIRIHQRETDDGLVITYDDNGIGISGVDKERLFQRGFGKHTGLGLYMAREILSITGIKINETGKHGEGARFEIHVPKGAYRLEPSEVH